MSPNDRDSEFPEHLEDNVNPLIVSPTETKSVLTPQEEIQKEDAHFRRQFAGNMFGLVCATVGMTLAALLVASLALIQDPESDLANAIVLTIKDIFPVAFSGIMGVFGTVVGFYFAKGDSAS